MSMLLDSNFNEEMVFQSLSLLLNLAGGSLPQAQELRRVHISLGIYLIT